MTVRGRCVVVAALVAVAVLASGCAREARATPGARRHRTIELRIHHSRFLPSRLSVPADTHVRFVVRNEDPIAHELIIGNRSVHVRHERGTEASHPARPGEVSVEAGAAATTTFAFTTAGETEFACHLPGHYPYGMRGVVTVTP
jgi:uncharacterized cupredoxin-like copper-binding protein